MVKFLRQLQNKIISGKLKSSENSYHSCPSDKIVLFNPYSTYVNPYFAKILIECLAHILPLLSVLMLCSFFNFDRSKDIQTLSEKLSSNSLKEPVSPLASKEQALHL